VRSAPRDVVAPHRHFVEQWAGTEVFQVNNRY
jgi:hypothetical protein